VEHTCQVEPYGDPLRILEAPSVEGEGVLLVGRNPG
jgi:hypothetical protein